MPLTRRPRNVQVEVAAQRTSVADGLASPDPERRWTAARAAQVADCIGPLAAALRTESSSRVREAIFTSLARIGTPEAALHVLPMLRSDDAGLRTGALDALRIMITHSRDLLPPLLEDADVDVRVLSCELARTLPSSEATILLCEVLRRDADPNVCAAALDVLMEVGDRSALPTLSECAQRFEHNPFLAFAIQVTAERINAQPLDNRG